jgi:hypothetical protein
MNYIFEAILVGLYEVCLYFVFSQFIKNFFVLLLVIGFCKHFLGKLLGLQTWYCNNGSACIKVLSQNQKYIANSIHFVRTTKLRTLRKRLGFLTSLKLKNRTHRVSF